MDGTICPRAMWYTSACPGLWWILLWLLLLVRRCSFASCHPSSLCEFTLRILTSPVWGYRNEEMLFKSCYCLVLPLNSFLGFALKHQTWLELNLPHFQFSSVAQSCLILCDPMKCSTPGLQVSTVLHLFPISDGTRCHDISFLNVELCTRNA